MIAEFCATVRHAIRARLPVNINNAEELREVVAALERPADYFLIHCQQQRAAAVVRRDTKDAIFWQRLEGSVKKAAQM